MTWVNLGEIEEYVAKTNPHLSFREVKAVAEDAAALMMTEGAVYRTTPSGTTVSFPSGYVGHVAQKDGGFIWRVASGEGDLASGQASDGEEAFMAVESMVETLLSEGV